MVISTGRAPLALSAARRAALCVLTHLVVRRSFSLQLARAVTSSSHTGRRRRHMPERPDSSQQQSARSNGHSSARGRESGPARLEQAVAAFRDALMEYARERAPLQWAATQSNLGGALATLGARESGTARLEEAVAAYRDALTERTRERVPLDWAATQNNLGTALPTLGERESGSARQHTAVPPSPDPLTGRPPHHDPLQWAATQN